MKAIICVFAPANCGKTTAIREAYNHLRSLIDDSFIPVTTGEVSEVVKYHNNNVAFASAGDTEWQVNNSWEIIKEKEKGAIDILVCASRTKGSSVNKVGELANSNGQGAVPVIWVSPLYTENDVKALQPRATQANVHFILDAIDKYIQDGNN